MTAQEQNLVEAARAVMDVFTRGIASMNDVGLAYPGLSAALAPYEPETIDIGGVRVNAGMREAPKSGESYWVPSFGNAFTNYVGYSWNADSHDLTFLRNGMCCRSPEDAIAMHDAFTRLTGVAG
jgi:hypothetical protein